MNEQERLEEILRGIHILFAEAEPVLDEDDLVIVDQKSLYRLLEELNRCVTDIMERYAVTLQSREAAENRTRRDLEKMVSKAQQTADEFYTSSLLYMDGTLQEMSKRMQRMQKDLLSVTGAFAQDIEARLQDVNANREELRDQMHTLMEEEQYLTLVRQSRSFWDNGDEEEDLEDPDDEDLEGYDPVLMGTDRMSEDPEIRIHTDSAYFRAREAAKAAAENEDRQ